MKIALITDQHFGVRNDSQLFLDYFEKFYSEIFFPYIKKHNITTIVDLGDSLDRRKYINYVTLQRMNKMWLNPIIENGIELHSLVGNHNIYYRNTNELNSFDSLFDHPNIHCYSDPTNIKFGGIDIAMLPWINHTNYADAMEFVKNNKADTLFSHLELAGFEMHLGMKNEHGMSREIFEDFDIVCSGHYHHKSTSGNINYLGTPYEMTWSDFNDRRGFHIFDSATREIDFIHNPYRMFHKIWYDDTGKTLDDLVEQDFSTYTNTYVKLIVQNKENPYWFDMMLDKLYKANPADIKIVDDHNNINQLTEDEIISEAEDTLTILHKCVDNMATSGNKAGLQSLMSSLYLEAQNLET